ncbi:hypothetical protein LWI28_026932 [Acer negundo]|uniref:Uncharacterized protein n=1 Tax=Acer negundo TaxID=4023 RepID=A0AAD5NZB9_ACENE|nr:hypothetical protein LWI28_026932 [Acer negundo]
MEQLNNINSEAAQYVTDVGIERWAQAYSPRKRYKLMSTNITEAMNNAIKECKELPITGVIDYIRGVLQSWFHDRHIAAFKLTTQLTIAANVAIGVKDEKARYMRIYPITFYTFLKIRVPVDHRVLVLHDRFESGMGRSDTITNGARSQTQLGIENEQNPLRGGTILGLTLLVD